MKRLFQRRSSSTSLSPERTPSTPAAAHKPEKKAHKAHALPESASQLTESVHDGPATPVATRSVIVDLHESVITFVASQTESAQMDALKAIGSHSAMEIRSQLNAKEKSMLASVCAHRLQVTLQKELDAYNTSKLQHSQVIMFAAADGKALVVLSLSILQSLMLQAESDQVVLLVSERLPSTLVKLLKALSSSKSVEHNSVVEAILSLLESLASSRHVIQELMETNTLHRLFGLSFERNDMQATVLSVLDRLVQSVMPSDWEALTEHIYEHSCLAELTGGVCGTFSLAKAIVITAATLKSAFASGSKQLHEQLRTQNYYPSLVSLVIRYIEADIDQRFDTYNSMDISDHQNAVVSAIGVLCMSGNERSGSMKAIDKEKCFSLKARREAVPNSDFNDEAFRIVPALMDYLHSSKQMETKSDLDTATIEAKRVYLGDLERLYIEKVGQILVQSPYDYVFVQDTHVLEKIIARIDSYSDVTKHTIGSVLSGIAIEANVIPYAELKAIGEFISKGCFDTNSLMVLLVFTINALRFDEAYRRVLVSVGILGCLVNLYQKQIMFRCSSGVASTKINVAYPSSTIQVGSHNEAAGDFIAVSEQDLLSFITSHCRQTCVARQHNDFDTVIDNREFVLLVEILILSTGVKSTLSAGNDEEIAYLHSMCNVNMLESICVHIANESQQHYGLSLWAAVFRLALTFKKQSPSLYDTVNCLLQAVRYITIAVHYRSDENVTFAFKGSMKALQVVLWCLEQLVESVQDCNTTKNHDTPEISDIFRPGEFTKADCDCILVVLADCGVSYSCLAVLWVLGNLANYVIGNVKSYLVEVCITVKSLMSVLHILGMRDNMPSDVFQRSTTFGLYGNLLHRLFLQISGSYEDNNLGDAERVTSGNFIYCCMQSLLGFAVCDRESIYSENTFELCYTKNSFASTILKHHLGIEQAKKTRLSEVRIPGALAIVIQLLSLWNTTLTKDQCERILSFCVDSTNGNVKKLANAGLTEIIMRSFACPRPKDDNFSDTTHEISVALLYENHHFHGQVTSLLKNVSRSTLSGREISFWIKLLLYMNSTRKVEKLSDRCSSMACSAYLFELLLDLSMLRESFQKVPSIAFNVSVDGFAYIQISEIHARLLSAANVNSSKPTTSALSNLAHPSKVWPPPDGYSVIVWFRIDSIEPKEDREHLYRESFLANKCILCQGPLRDESTLKCSHRACRGCHEALLNSGGECVVCNPPMFYLFRFRSGDGKSVSEVYLKGTKLYMRTSSSRSSHQFTHFTLEPKVWYQGTFVHSKQRFQSSMASCYLNGILQETVKMSYPSSVSSGQPLSGMIGISSQARRVSRATWTLGSFYLIDEPITEHVINCAYATGPKYGELYAGDSGHGEVAVTLDHLDIANLVQLDEYMRDPIRTLIQSVDTERVTKSSILRGGLSLASAASSAAAVLVQDLKSNASLFARIPSPVPLVNASLHQDHIVVAYTPHNIVGIDESVMPNSILDGRPIAQLIGGTTVNVSTSISDVLADFCGSACQTAYVLLEQAQTSSELESALSFLWNCTYGDARNLEAMEEEHGYGIVNYLLQHKTNLLTKTSLIILFQISGVDVEWNTSEKSLEDIIYKPVRQSIIRNLQALQYFILDYSLWEQVETDTQKLLFSSLYSCLVVDDGSIRERNRLQLQSLSIVKQLLYVFSDTNVEMDLLRVIADLILVCLTGTSRESAIEANFMDVACFLTSTLSPRFARSRADGKEHISQGSLSESKKDKITSILHGDSYFSMLSLSPRGSMLNKLRLPRGGRCFSLDSSICMESFPGDTQHSTWRLHQMQVQNLLLDILSKAVQKHDLKESKERDDIDSFPPATDNDTFGTNGAGSGAQSSSARMQLPSSSRLTGFRKVLSPRWMGYFLWPTVDTSKFAPMPPSTIILALKLLRALLARPKYETAFKKDGYYRMLAHGLPCANDHYSGIILASVPFDEMWYSLFCIMLGTPVDGIPHKIEFEMFYLCKDFELNIQTDRVLNTNIIWVILVCLRRHYDLTSARTSSRLSWFLSHGSEKDFYAVEVLKFLRHLYVHMPSFQKLFMANEKVRADLMGELSFLVCSACRARVIEKYPHKEDMIQQSLLSQNKPMTGHLLSGCGVELSEHMAAKDELGEDPFLHPTAIHSFQLLEDILMNFLLELPKGNDVVESFFDSSFGLSLSPPLHEGLQLRFQGILLLRLLDKIHSSFGDESVLTEHKAFGYNLRQFLKFSVRKMQAWQRAQHGDNCPTAFACCGKVHFEEGPLRLLELVLFILAETSVGIFGGAVPTTMATSFASIGSTLSGMKNDMLSKGKKRRPQIRQILGRMNLSRSVELETLTATLYVALNTVVLHIMSGHGADINDDDLNLMLQVIHIHRDVVLGSRNNQDKDFFICLCRYLLQLVADSNDELQESAAHIWTDLLYYQRSFMVDLLTIEIRRPGATPYSVNLMKNGFDMLLKCAPEVDGARIIDSASYLKFKKWLELLGPPLRELEIDLDRVFLKRAVGIKETVSEEWNIYHKKMMHTKNKLQRRHISRQEWYRTISKMSIETLLEAQQKEFQRQLKWRQDRVDRQKFIARQWQQVKVNLLEHSLGVGLDDLDCQSVALANPALMNSIALASIVSTPAARGAWRLDFTEGPHRMRKRFLRPLHLTKEPWVIQSKERRPREFHSGVLMRRRRHSEGDLASLIKSGAFEHVSCAWHQRSRSAKLLTNTDGCAVNELFPVLRRVSANVLSGSNSQGAVPDQAEDGFNIIESGGRRYTSLSTNHDSGDEDDDDDRSEFEVFNGGLNAEDYVVDEKLRPLLMLGDDISDIYDCLRVDGMDSCPGVFLVCNNNAYIVDNYQRLSSVSQTEGALRSGAQEVVVEVSKGTTTRLERRLSMRPQNLVSWDEPAENAVKLSSTITDSVLASSDAHRCRYWSYEDIMELHKRRYQLRHVAIEIFAHDGRNYLIAFESTQERENVFNSLLAKCPNVRGAASGMDRVAVAGDLYSHLRKLLRNNMTERWVGGEISNFEYLMHLNTLAGRSYNDLTQYPVFPWVLSDYESDELDLNNPNVFRDLTKPMGALHREEEFRIRYDTLAESADPADQSSTKPFHYGTHYSSAGIVLHYLMRIEPFTSHFIQLQGGKFDLADRLFSSIQGAWKSAAGLESAQNGTQDVKELIPEFFYLPEFLENMNQHDFGTDQDGIKVDTVHLPPWAHGSASEFVRMNREALESHYVSTNLHHWIDLIFGYKQQGAAAVVACNVFYYLTYEGAVDLDSVADSAMKRAIVDQIKEFGQTPSQLFKSPHPARARSTMPYYSNGSLSSSSGPWSSHTSSTANDAGVDHSAVNAGSSVSSSVQRTSTSNNSRALLSGSFIAMDGGELINRMQTILANSVLRGGFDDTTVILENAPMLQQEPRREMTMNPLLAAYRGLHYTSLGVPTTRTRQLASGGYVAGIHQIGLASSSVGRDERHVAVGENCLLIPPKNNEYLAWAFQDRSLKVITTGTYEGAHGGDSKVIASFELDYDIRVACVTSDGRLVVSGGGSSPALRVWQYSKKSAGVSSSATRRRAYTVGVHPSSSSARSMTLAATLSTPLHSGSITAVEVSRTYSVIVSGCAGGIAVLWDLNRMRFVRSLPSFTKRSSLLNNNGSPMLTHSNGGRIGAIAINEVSGDIVIACGRVFGVFDVNANLLVRLEMESMMHDLMGNAQASIVSIALNRSEVSAWSKEKAVITGHDNGELCLWAYSQSGSEWCIELKGKHLASKSLSATNNNHGSSGTLVSPAPPLKPPALSAVYLSADERKLYTGNSDGLISLWTTTSAVTPPTSSS